MSPEQAKGKPVDRRTDIGLSLRALRNVTGQMAFARDNTDILAACSRKKPDWSQLPAATPPQVRPSWIDA